MKFTSIKKNFSQKHNIYFRNIHSQSLSLSSHPHMYTIQQLKWQHAAATTRFDGNVPDTITYYITSWHGRKILGLNFRFFFFRLYKIPHAEETSHVTEKKNVSFACQGVYIWNFHSNDVCVTPFFHDCCTRNKSECQVCAWASANQKYINVSRISI